MAEGKKSFLFYTNWGNTFDELSNEDAGKLIKHICDYVRDKNPQTDNILIKAVFANIKSILKMDLDKWNAKSLKNSENAKKRWDKNNANAYDRIKRNANHADIVNDNVIDIVNDTVNVNVKEKKTKKEDAAKSGPPDEYKNIIKIWFEFVEKRTGVKPKFNGVDGKSLKSIIEYISKNQNEGQKTEDTFQYILNNWGRLENWLQSNALDLKIFNQKINIIISQLKNGTTNKKGSNSFGENFIEHLRANDPNFKNY